MIDWLADCKLCGGPCTEARCREYFDQLTGYVPQMDIEEPDAVLCEHNVDITQMRCRECDRLELGDIQHDEEMIAKWESA